MRKRHRFASTILPLALCLPLLVSGCGPTSAPSASQSSPRSPSAGTPAPSPVPTDTADFPGDSPPNQSNSDILDFNETTRANNAQAPGASSAESPVSNIPADSPPAPRLPQTGSKPADFIPDGWALMDTAALDYNQDGRMDYVGVLQMEGSDIPLKTPRILFALASSEESSYRLDFQDENLIRTRDEGGVFGDPYVPLTAGETTFTTNAYGGSAWRWSEAYTYAYRDGGWYLSKSHTTYGYGPMITSETFDDYETGVGIRRERRSDIENPENLDSDEFDLDYQVRLDAPPDIVQAGKRWWLSPDRLTDCPVKTITTADGIDLDRSAITLPLDGAIHYRDENLILYTFSAPASETNYLACYQEDRQSLTVAAQSTEEMPNFDACLAYKGKIYYAMDVTALVHLRGADQTVVPSMDTVAQKLFCMNPDGSGKQELFEYRIAEPGETIEDEYLPYLSMSCEITGDEIILQVYVGGRPHPYYRMDLDGGNVREIGFLPDEN